MKTVIRLVSSVCVVVAVMVGTARAEDSITLRLSMHQSSTSPETVQIIEPLVKFIEERSGGFLKVKTFPNGSLHGAAEGFKALATDVSDIAPAYPIYQSRSFHLSHVTNLPFAFPNAYVGGRVSGELYAEYFKDEWAKLGCFPLFYAVTATYDLLTTKPVSSLADLKGMKIRGGGAALNEIIKRLGATPVTIQSPEVYTAFQQGVVDGLLFNTASILSFRLDEIGKYYIPLGVSRVGIPWAMSTKTYQALPADMQKVMREAGSEAAVLYADYVTRDTEAAVEAMKARGITMVTLPEDDIKTVREAVEPMWQAFVQENATKGPAQALVDALRAKVAGYGPMTRGEFVKLEESQPVAGLMPSE